MMWKTAIRLWKVQPLCQDFLWKLILMSGSLFNFVWRNLNYKCYTTTGTYWFGVVYSGLSKPCSRYMFVTLLFVTLLYSELQGCLNQYDKATNVFVCQWHVYYNFCGLVKWVTSVCEGIPAVKGKEQTKT